MNKYQFIIYHKNGSKRQTTVYAKSEDEAYDRIYENFSEIEYVDLF